MRLAVIDLGTNSTRLLIADIEGSQLLEVQRRSVITRLGDGVDRNGNLNSEAIFRTVYVLKEFALKIKEEEVEKVRCIGTSSLRDAENARELSLMIKEDFGFELEILSGAEEARLSFLGATKSRDPNFTYLVFDVGGGSTEIGCGKGFNPDKTVSLDIGCVRLSERFLKSNPPEAGELEALELEIDKILTGHLANCNYRVDKALGLAGTVTTLAAVVQKMTEYDPRKIHGFSLSRNTVEDLYNRFRNLTYKEISRIPGIQSGRETVILAGTALVLSIMNRFLLVSLEVSESDILDGALLELKS